MKLLTDNNIPLSVISALEGFECASVRDVLTPDASDARIYEWCRENDVGLFVTKDKQFAWRIAKDGTRLKCIFCTFGNLSVRETVEVFASNKSRIEYFAKSPLKILEL